MAASELQKAIDRLVQQEPGWKKFTQPPAAGGRSGARSTGYPGSKTGQFVFAETDAALREHYDERTIISSDGFFSFSYRPIKSIDLEGGNKATFKEPPA